MDWPHFDPRFWGKVLADAGKAIVSDIPDIIASDRDRGAIQAAQANAERAGVAGCIEFSHKPISAIDPPIGPGWVITNPPYGVRLREKKDLRNLYAQLGKVLRTRCPGWHVAMLCEADNDQLIHNTGLALDPSRSLSLVNGGLKVKLARGQVE